MSVVDLDCSVLTHEHHNSGEITTTMASMVDGCHSNVEGNGNEVLIQRNRCFLATFYCIASSPLPSISTGGWVNNLLWHCTQTYTEMYI